MSQGFKIWGGGLPLNIHNGILQQASLIGPISDQPIFKTWLVRLNMPAHTRLSTFLTSCSLPHARAKCRVKCTGQGLGKRSRGKCIGRASAMGKGTRQGNRPEHGARAWDKGTGHRERGKGTGQVHGGRARGMCIGQGHGISAHAKCNFTRQGLR